MEEMYLTVLRSFSDNDSTLSIVFLDGKAECFGVEDEYREEKVVGETRIPAGTYKCGIRAEGGFHNRYSEKYTDIHRGMIEVLNVPDFDYILIHVGNDEGDTAGCLCVGSGCNILSMTVPSSVIAYKKLYSKIIDAAEQDKLWITYIDNDLEVDF